MEELLLTALFINEGLSEKMEVFLSLSLFLSPVFYKFSTS